MSHYSVGVISKSLTDIVDMMNQYVDDKWDFYAIGGRFCGYLLVKSIVTEKDEYKSEILLKGGPQGFCHVNFAKIKDIEWDKMQELTNSPFFTYSVLSENGWFDCDDISEIESSSWDKVKEWAKNYYEKFIKPANPEYYFTIIDCHV